MQSPQEPEGAAQPSTSKSSSFAFSRAGLAMTSGAQSCPEEAEAAQRASVHPLGFFAAEGAQQLCNVEGERTGLLSAESVVGCCHASEACSIGFIGAACLSSKAGMKAVWSRTVVCDM
jgi:hypothetical protein